MIIKFKSYNKITFSFLTLYILLGMFLSLVCIIQEVTMYISIPVYLLTFLSFLILVISNKLVGPFLIFCSILFLTRFTLGGQSLYIYLFALLTPIFILHFNKSITSMKWFNTNLNKLLMIFLFCIVITLLYSFNRLESISYAISLIGPISIYFFTNFFINIKSMNGKSKILLILSALTISGIIISILSIYQYYMVYEEFGRKRDGFFGNPNYFSGILNFIFPLVVYMYKYIDKKNIIVRNAIIASLLLMTASIFYSAAKSSILVIIIQVFLFLFNKETRMVISRYLLLLLLLIIGFSGFFYEKINYTIELILGDYLFQQNIQDYSRFRLLESAIQVISDRPFFGVGLGAFPSFSYSIGNDYLRPHNIILQLWSETGILPTIIFTFIIITILKYIFICRYRGDLLLTLALCFIGLFIYIMTHGNGLPFYGLWIFLGLVNNLFVFDDDSLNSKVTNKYKEVYYEN